MIYDCFTFYKEYDILDIRLNELNNYVDKFILVESSTTFSGEPKPLYYQENKDLFEKFNHKIIHVPVLDLPIDSNPWIPENEQRNMILRGLPFINDKDYILISDVDEIPNTSMIGIVGSFLQFFSYYYLNTIKSYKWVGTVGVTGEMLKKHKPQYFRDSRFSMPHIQSGGWHFSYLMNIDDIAQKIKHFAHQEFNKEEFTDKDKIIQRINTLKDLFDRTNEDLTKVTELDFLPKYCQRNLDKISQYILK